MSAARTSGRLLRCYPPAWRARYGQELEALIVESSGGGRVPWRTRGDVALTGLRERLRATGLGGEAPGDRVRGGVLLVLCAWALFVIAGGVVQKVSEHWQDVTPAASRGLPATAFAALVVVAVCASVLVAAGIAATLPSLAAFLRGGGWPAIRRRILTAVLVTGVALAATAALAVWAHGLTAPERSGHDAAYGVAFVSWALLVAGCLLAWTAAAVTTARRLPLRAPALRLVAWLAGAVTVAMGVMTAATVVWWAAVGHAAPWFFSGGRIESAASPLAPQLLAATALMASATLLAIAGAQRALRALPALSGRP